MSKTKIFRCKVHGCRTLTANIICKAHSRKDKAPITQPDKKIQGRNTKIAQRKRNAQHLDSTNMRTELNALREGAEKLVRNNETPAFYKGENYGFR